MAVDAAAVAGSSSDDAVAEFLGKKQAAPEPEPEEEPEQNNNPPMGQGAPTVGIHPNIVFVAAFSLVVVNGITSGQLGAFWNIAWKGGVAKAGSSLASNTGILLGELLFVFVIGFMAEISEDVSNVLFALVVGLWILWAVGNGQTLTKWTRTLTGGVK